MSKRYPFLGKMKCMSQYRDGKSAKCNIAVGDKVLSRGLFGREVLAYGTFQFDAVKQHIPFATDAGYAHFTSDSQNAELAFPTWMRFLQFQQVADLHGDDGCGHSASVAARVPGILSAMLTHMQNIPYNYITTIEKCKRYSTIFH